MTSYTIITDEETDPGAPVTSELLKKERDNPIAMAEGASGAPRVQGKALGGVSMGATSAAINAYRQYNNCDGMATVVGYICGSFNNSYALRIALSNNNGETFGSSITLQSPMVISAAAIGHIRINLQTGVWYLSFLRLDTVTEDKTYSGSFTPISNCNSFRLYGIGGSVDFYCLGGLE